MCYTTIVEAKMEHRRRLVQPAWGGQKKASKRFHALVEEDDVPTNAASLLQPPEPMSCWQSISMKIKSRFGSKARQRRQLEVALYACSVALEAINVKLQNLKQSRAKAEGEMVRLMSLNEPQDAICALRRKKFYTRQIQSVEKHKLQVQAQQMALQESETNLEVFKSLQLVGRSLRSFAVKGGDVQLNLIERNEEIMHDAVDNLREVRDAMVPLDDLIEGEDETTLWEELVAATGGHETPPTPNKEYRLPKAPNMPVKVDTQQKVATAEENQQQVELI